MADITEKVQPADQEIIEDTSSFTSNESIKGHTLQRGLKAHHIQMIALGGTIGKFKCNNMTQDILLHTDAS